MNVLAKCALAGVDPVGVINAGPAERDLLLSVAAEVHRLNNEAQKKAGRK